MAENVMLNKIREFENQFQLIDDPYKKVDQLVWFCLEYMDSMVYTELCLEKAELCREILKTIDYPKGNADCLAAFCFYSWAKANHDDAKKYGDKALALSAQLGAKDVEGFILTLYAYINVSHGNYDEALKNSFDAIRLFKSMPSSVIKSWAHYSLGIIYYETKDYKSAMKVYREAEEIVNELNFTYGKARSESFKASVYIALDDYAKGREYIEKSIPLYREVGHDIGLSRALNDLGVICRKTGNYEDAVTYLSESYQIREAVKHTQGMITTSYELGMLMLSLKRPEEALKWLLIARELSEKIKAKSKEFQVQKALAEAYEQMGNYKDAYRHLEKFAEIKEEVAGQNAAQKIKHIQTEKAEREAEIERLKNVELKQAHDIISAKNKEIVDSINYAWRIQSALLNADKLLKDNLKEYFVLFKPKDIVSGDFYWAHKDREALYIAVCDSTGHGVPGAFMSILNATYLNEAISEKELAKPNEIFDHVRRKLIENISQEDQKDGMDGILISASLNPSKGGNIITYAAAYNTPVIIRNKQLIELPTDKMPVGKGEKEEPFTLRTIDAKKGDILYLYTDGYADQFGGPNGKKLKYKVLEEFLLNISELPMDRQKAELDKKFSSWKGNLEQVDDVLIMGIKI